MSRTARAAARGPYLRFCAGIAFMTARRKLLLMCLSGLALGGCGLLPTSGPDDVAIRNQAFISSPPPDAPLAYELVPVNANNVGELSIPRSSAPSDNFVERGSRPIIRLGPGDVIGVTIFEAAPGGLFTPSQTSGARPGNFVDLPAQSVDERGNIAIPFAGQIPVAGKTTPEVEHIIQERLKNRAIEPQVVVAVREQHATIVSVLGEVNQPGPIPLSQSGQRILELIARAGGPKYPSNESYVILQRGGAKTKVLLSRIVADPKQNIYARPNDTIYLQHELATFTAVGASGANGLYPFENEHITLSQALGKAGGLLDIQANPAAFFVYRLEDRAFLEKIGVDVTRYPHDKIPTVYSIDMLDPAGLLLANGFQMREKDAIFVGNAKSVEFMKFLAIINAAALSDSNLMIAGRNSYRGFRP
jgi:polysaccharide biosynthesis/export protein